ncbi:hypothetical protein PCANC_24168 [Puccinia coronata f. sp. avenae]|uniref:Uncharacterized protein n=1 Tax=Puccinia coronata f. sp. avenae TaxID=200324 RepID=A0A2N5S562_9BASI|nr:hypothetical protein PCANC_24168 [Puccinia coronata f. sp. avenae]
MAVAAINSDAAIRASLAGSATPSKMCPPNPCQLEWEPTPCQMCLPRPLTLVMAANLSKMPQPCPYVLVPRRQPLEDNHHLVGLQSHLPQAVTLLFSGIPPPFSSSAASAAGAISQQSNVYTQPGVKRTVHLDYILYSCLVIALAPNRQCGPLHCP